MEGGREGGREGRKERERESSLSYVHGGRTRKLATVLVLNLHHSCFHR